MPQWNERQRLTIDNLLATFSADIFKKIISGQIYLALSKEADISYFHPCDVEKRDTPRYWAVHDNRLGYIDEDIIKQGGEFNRFHISQHGCRNLLRQAIDSPKAFDVLSYLFSNGGFYDASVSLHNITTRNQFIASLVEDPRLLITLAHTMVRGEDEAITAFIAFLFSLSSGSPSTLFIGVPSTFSQLLTKECETQTVLYALLSSPRVCDKLTKDQFLIVVASAYQVKLPLTSSYIDRIARLDLDLSYLSDVFIAAARCGDVKMVQRLLAVNATRRLVDADHVSAEGGETALHCALRSSLSDELIYQLITQAKNLSHCDHQGYSPITLAFKMGRSTVIDALLGFESVRDALLTDKPLSNTVLHAAVAADDIGMIRRALAIPGIERIINCFDMHGDTALSLAVRARKLDHVELLMQHGANVHSSNVEGSSPLDYARSQPDMYDLLRCPPSPREVSPAGKKEPALADDELELRKARVISILHGQMETDRAYTVDVPVVRKGLVEACERIQAAESPHVIHRELVALHKEKIILTDAKGVTSTHKFLRQVTVAQLKYYGFLHHVPLSGFRARATDWGNSLYSMFHSRPPAVPVESPTPDLPVPSAPPESAKPNDVAAAGAGAKCRG
ncbi:MAG: ankyrin repeat domain-containing protein [Coxiellaceae bacterium]|nr:ankyrin repeat domain-containing protein [Coxiellaceae bacterium]